MQGVVTCSSPGGSDMLCFPSLVQSRHMHGGRTSCNVPQTHDDDDDDQQPFRNGGKTINHPLVATTTTLHHHQQPTRQRQQPSGSIKLIHSWNKAVVGTEQLRSTQLTTHRPIHHGGSDTNRKLRCKERKP